MEESLKNIPKENIIEPPTYLAIPAVQKFFYTDDEKLRQMFVNLLATSMNKETTNKAHPSFVEIISQITPDEAKLLKYLATQTFLPKIDVLIYDLSTQDRYNILDKNVSLFGQKTELDYPQKAPIYFNNFERLGLLKIWYSTAWDKHTCSEDYVYQELLEMCKQIIYNNYDTTIFEKTFEKGLFEITEFGKMFLEVVV